MKSFWYDSDGTRLFAVEQGSGEGVVVLHGGMADHRAVMPYLQSLGEAFRVAAPDLRGNGKSWCDGKLAFGQFTRDLSALLDCLGWHRAVVVGVSSGTGIALHFALAHPDRLAGLVLVQPVYAGREQGYTPDQAAMFAWMDSFASQALRQGVAVLKPLYANLPPPYREQVLAMSQEFDPASVVATSAFLAGGQQPFERLNQLQGIACPTLLVKGADPLHPPALSQAYLTQLPGAIAVEAADPQAIARVRAFCASCCGPGAAPAG